MEDKKFTNIWIFSPRTIKPRLQKTRRRTMSDKRWIQQHGGQTAKKNARLSNRVHPEEVQLQSIRSLDIWTAKTIHAINFKQMIIIIWYSKCISLLSLCHPNLFYPRIYCPSNILTAQNQITCSMCLKCTEENIDFFSGFQL